MHISRKRKFESTRRVVRLGNDKARSSPMKGSISMLCSCRPESDVRDFHDGMKGQDVLVYT